MSKFCVDCKHLRVGVCHSPNNGIDLVTGQSKMQWASYSRKYECGPDANFFEPIEEKKAFSLIKYVMRWHSR